MTGSDASEGRRPRLPARQRRLNAAWYTWTCLILIAGMAGEAYSLGVQPFGGFPAEAVIGGLLAPAILAWWDPPWSRPARTAAPSAPVERSMLGRTSVVALIFLIFGLIVAWPADHPWHVKIAAAAVFALGTTALLEVSGRVTRRISPRRDGPEAEAVGHSNAADE